MNGEKSIQGFFLIYRAPSLLNADLFGADLGNVNLKDANLSGSDLRLADLNEVNLFGANLSQADLSQAELFRADLGMVNFTEADLNGVDLSTAQVSGTNFRKAVLTGICIYRCSISNSQIEAVDCQYVYLKFPKDERFPTKRNFEPGEFTRRCQEEQDRDRKRYAQTSTRFEKNKPDENL